MASSSPSYVIRFHFLSVLLDFQAGPFSLQLLKFNVFLLLLLFSFSLPFLGYVPFLFLYYCHFSGVSRKSGSKLMLSSTFNG